LSHFKKNTVWLGEIFEASKSDAVTQQARKISASYTKLCVYLFYLVLTIQPVCL